MGRLVGPVALILVLYAILTQPLTSGATARSGGAALGSVGFSPGAFVSSVAAGSSGGTTSSSRVAATSSEVAPGPYQVRPGDTLSTIAASHGTSASRIAARNDLSDLNHIHPGQRLTLQ